MLHMYEDLETLEEYNEFTKFNIKWNKLEKNNLIPGWYKFNPRKPLKPSDHQGMMKKWNFALFDFLKDQTWNKSQIDSHGRRKYIEQSYFVVDCNQLLGMGGEGIVIRKKSTDLFDRTATEQNDEEYKAVKIVPIMKHKFKDDDFVAKILKAAQDLETEANVDGTEFEHDNVIEYSNIQFDFIKNFNDRTFVIIIGKSNLVFKK